MKPPSRKSGTNRRTATNHLLQEPTETFIEFESATHFKGFEPLHDIVLDIDDQLLCFDVQTKAVKHMYDDLRRSIETFQRNANKLTLNVKR